MIAVSQCTMQFNGIPLFDGITFTVGDQDKIGLVGKNGAGKSTLLNVLYGDIKPESGVITTSKQHTIGFLKQQLHADYTGTVKEECRSAFDAVLNIEDELESLQITITEYTDYDNPEYSELCERMSDLYAQLEILGGNTIEASIEKILLGLGFTHESMQKQAKELSGGWQMRLELAKLLLRKPHTLPITLILTPFVGWKHILHNMMAPLYWFLMTEYFWIRSRKEQLKSGMLELKIIHAPIQSM
jgi:ATP-binding cassette subfamily F protein 3